MSGGLRASHRRQERSVSLPDTITLDGVLPAHLEARLGHNEDGTHSGNVFVTIRGANTSWVRCTPDDFEAFCRAGLDLVAKLR